MTPEQERMKLGDVYQEFMDTKTVDLCALVHNEMIRDGNWVGIATLPIRKIFSCMKKVGVGRDIVSKEEKENGTGSFWTALIISMDRDVGNRKYTVDYVKIINEMYGVWLYGEQTFLLSEDLTSALLLTDIGNARMEDLRLPFDAFVIRIPREAVYFSYDTPGDMKRQLDSIIVSQTPNSPDFLHVTFLLSSEDLAGPANLANHVPADVIRSGTVREVVDDKLDSIQTSSNMNVPITGHRHVSAFKDVMRLVIAAILYISDFPEDRKRYVSNKEKTLKKKIANSKGRAKKKAQKKLDEMVRISVIGADYKLDRDPSSNGEHVEVRAASYVRGHRRMQPYGPGKSYKKPIWIKPHWRNIDGEKRKKRYHVV